MAGRVYKGIIQITCLWSLNVPEGWNEEEEMEERWRTLTVVVKDKKKMSVDLVGNRCGGDA